MAVGAEKSDAIAGFDAGLAQGTGKPGSSLGKLGIREPVVVADHCGPAGILLLRIAKETQGCKRNIHCVPRLDQAD
jgi:hypothetical protein